MGYRGKHRPPQRLSTPSRVVLTLGLALVSTTLISAAGPGSAAVPAYALDRTDAPRASRNFTRAPLTLTVATEKAESAAAKRDALARRLANERAAEAARVKAAAAAKVAAAKAKAAAQAAAAKKAQSAAAAAKVAKKARVAKAAKAARAAKAAAAAAAVKEKTRDAAAQRAAQAAETLTDAPAGVAADHREYARAAAAKRGWNETEFGCLDAIWTQESQWKANATNPSSGAYGIPQALPASKMASAGKDWRTNAHTQIDWGLGYIAQRYKTPCAAWAFKAKTGWY